MIILYIVDVYYDQNQIYAKMKHEFAPKIL